MQTAYLFHDNRCCLTDCMVRACTCGVEPVPGPEASGVGEALSQGSDIVGDVRADGSSIAWLSGTVDEEDGTLLLHFITARSPDDDDDADEP